MSYTHTLHLNCLSTTHSFVVYVHSQWLFGITAICKIVPQQASSATRKSSYSGVIREVRAAQNLKCDIRDLQIAKVGHSTACPKAEFHLFPALPITSHHFPPSSEANTGQRWGTNGPTTWSVLSYTHTHFPFKLQFVGCKPPNHESWVITTSQGDGSKP